MAPSVESFAGLRFGIHSADTESDTDTAADIFEVLNSREYQLEMFEQSKKQNIIVCMDTGSGKTQIARLLIDFELQQEPDLLTWLMTPTQELAKQQHIFLSEQLPNYSFRVITGADSAEYWGQRTWEAALHGQNGIVSTPAILADALSHGYVSFDRISLLVFDEAHHCIAKHPYNKIMGSLKDRSQKDDGLRIPRILGLTATPMIRNDLRLIEQVESNLTAVCKSPTNNIQQYRGIAHLPKLIWLPYAVSDGEQSVLLPRLESLLREYSLDDDPTISRLEQSDNPHDQQKLKKCLSRNEKPTSWQIKDLFQKATHIAEHLGAWAADHYIHDCIAKLEKSVEVHQECLFMIESTEVSHLARLLEPILLESLPDRPTDLGITSKVHKLVEFLQASQSDGMSCVVFVERRSVAYSLHAVLVTVPALQKCHAFTFVGSANPLHRNLADLADLPLQQTAFANFRQGTRNLCIATQVLEEGIDIQACNVVISFDIPKTARSYIQRRGRARHPDAVFVFMHCGSAPALEQAPWEQLEREMKEACAQQDRLLKELGDSRASQLETVNFPPICTTIAQIGVDDVKQHLQHFCQTMARQGEEPPRPLYLLEHHENSFYGCRVLLPCVLPPHLREICGSKYWKTEVAAKKDVAFQAYRAILDAGLLNGNLLPLHVGTARQGNPNLPIETRDSVLETINSFNLWYESRTGLVQQKPLLAYRITIPGCESVVVLVPFKLPQAVCCELHQSTDQAVVATVQPRTITMEEYHTIAIDITKHLFSSVLKRRLDGLEQSDYMLPYYVVPDLAPQAWSAWLEATRQREPLSNHIFDKSDEILLYREGQTVPFFFKPSPRKATYPPSGTIEATRLHRRLDFCQASTGTDTAPSQQDIPIQACSVSGLPPGIARAMAFIPSIMYQMETALRSQQALTQTPLRDIGLDFGVAKSAFVSPSVGRDNYQRLEYLGDVVLKYMASINTFCNNPNYSEGALTDVMFHLINNARLHRSTLELGLDKYLTTEPFLAGVGRCRQPWQEYTIEALLGASYEQALKKHFVLVVKALSLFLPEVTWRTPEEDVARYAVDKPWGTTNNHLLSNLQNLTKYHFRQPVLLAEALNHSSRHSQVRTYDRLEYIGDAILDLLVKEAIYNSKHRYDEGHMTAARHALVNKEILAFLGAQTSIEIDTQNIQSDLRTETQSVNPAGRKKCLHDFLAREPNIGMAAQGRAFMNRYQHKQHLINEALTTSKFWPWAELFHLASPKWASDVFESIVGAIFIDSGANLDRCRDLLSTLGLIKLVQRAVDEPDMEYLQKRQILRNRRPGKVKFQSRKYRAERSQDGEAQLMWECTVTISGKEPDTVEVTATVRGCSCVAEAEERAAIEALALLERATNCDSEGVVPDAGDLANEARKRKRADFDDTDAEDMESSSSFDEIMYEL